MSNIDHIVEDPFVSPHSNPEEIDVENTKHGGGRPRNVIWNYFENKPTKHPGHADAKCKFCNRYWKTGIVKKLQAHLARECENVDIETKNKFMYIVTRRDGVDVNMEIEATNENREKNRNNELSTEQIGLIDRLMLKAFVMCGIPFRIIENPYFINVFKNLQLSYNLPSRECLSTNLLSE